MNVDIGGTGRYSSDRIQPYNYSINSWSNWSKKNNCEVFVMDTLLASNEQFPICWQRYHLFNILEANEIDYDQILMVDCDTIVHPKAPNFFELTEHKYTGVRAYGSMDWVMRSIENYSHYIFENRMIDWWKYINGGFQIVNKNHINFFNEILKFQEKHSHSLREVEKFHVGTDQTPLNFLLQIHNIDLKILPYEYNMQDMSRFEILDNQLTFSKIGYVYHFNGIDNQIRNNIMQKTYTELYK